MASNDTRRYPARPLLGVGAIILDRTRVLLIERGKPPLEGFWSLPGGLVETGERLENAVAREVFEETGLDVKVGAIATVFERIMHEAEAAERCEYHYVLVDFYCSIRGGEMRPGDDSRDVRWFEIESLGGIAVTEGTREVIAACCARRVTHPHVTRP